MPKIPLLGEEQVLNATSPVPIGSSEAARQPGDTIAHFGQNLARAGENLAEFAKISQRSSDAATLDNAKANINAVAQQAHFNALGAVDDKGQPLQGQALVDKFSQNVDESTKDLLAQQKDPEMRGAISTEVQNYKNKMTLDLYTAATQRTVENIDSTNKKTVASNIGSLYATAGAGGNVENIVTQALGSIKNLGDSLDQQATYNPVARQKFKDLSTQQIAYAAVDSLAANKDYEGARKAADALKENIDPKHFTALQDRINTQEEHFEVQTRVNTEHATVEAERAKKEAQTNNANKLYFALEAEKDPVKRSKIIDGINDLGLRGGIDRTQAAAILAADRARNGGSAAAFWGPQAGAAAHTAANNLATQTLSNPNPVGVLEDLTQEVASGHMDPKTAKKFTDVLNLRSGVQKTDPVMFDKFIKSDGAVSDVFTKQLSEKYGANLGGVKADVQANVLTAKDLYIRQGIDPQTATLKALRENIPKPEQQPVIPGYSPARQTTLDGLNAIHQELALKARTTMTSAQKLEFLNQQKALAARMGAAQIHEGKLQ